MEAALPEIVAEHADGFFAGLLILLGKESAAGDHVYAEAGKVISRDDFAPDELGLVAVGHAEGAPAGSHKFGKTGVLGTKILPLRIRKSLNIISTVGDGEIDRLEAPGIVDRHGAQQVGIDQRIDRSVRADAQGERENHNGGEAGGFAEDAEGEAEVFPKRIHGRGGSRWIP